MYPSLEIDLKKLGENVKRVTDICKKYGIIVAGTIKGTTGIPECSRVFADNGAVEIASSRLNQIQDARDIGIKLPMLLLRVPMLSEVSEVIRLCDISLNSEISVLRALNAEAQRQGKIHKVILMADIGDLREGFWDKLKMADTALAIENEMENLHLFGIGTNVGCYGSVDPTREKLMELVEIAKMIEEKLGRRLELISGGATSSLKRLIDGDVPDRINHLRIGEGILLARDLEEFYGYDMSFLNRDVYTLKAEVIEVKDKPTHPVGQLAVDAFGKTPEYTDRGIRKRALLAIGKVDYGSSIEEIFPRMKGVEIIGASSDHTIIDIEDCRGEIKVGDVLEFDVNYASLCYVSNCPNVAVKFV